MTNLDEYERFALILDAIIRSFEAETTIERLKQQQEAVRIWREIEGEAQQRMSDTCNYVLTNGEVCGLDADAGHTHLLLSRSIPLTADADELVKRLREWLLGDSTDILDEAADTIEALQAQVRSLLRAREAVEVLCDAAEGSVEFMPVFIAKVRAALKGEAQ